MNKNAPKVGKYSVDLKSFENVALPTISVRILLKAMFCFIFYVSNVWIKVKDVGSKQIVIIDEIGKMESFSSKFERIVTDMMLNVHMQDFLMLATVPVRSLSISDKLKSHPFAKLFIVSEFQDLHLYVVLF